MADTTRTIEIIFGITDNISGGLNGISSGLSSFENSVGSVTGPLASLSTGLLKTEAAVIAVAAAYGGLAITNAAKFESAQIDLQKVLDGDDDSVTAAMKNFSEEAIVMSEKYGIASTDILQGFANFKQAGFDIEESLLLQVNALDLVIAGDVEAADATNILVRSIKGFGIEASEAARLIEAMNNVSNQFATSLGELARGMSALSPTASKMGFSLEETAGILTPIIEIFGSGSEAANALKVGLLQLISDNPRVVKELEKLGIAQRDQNGELKSGKDILQDVQVAFQGLTEKQQLASTAQLVGISQTTKMSLVFSELEKVTNITNVALEETGSVVTEVSLRLASAEVQVAKMQVSFTNLSAAVGAKLLPGFGEVVGGTNDILKAFRELVNDGGLDTLFDSLDSEFGDFSEFLKQIAVALPDAFKGLNLEPLISSFGNLKGSITGLFGDLDLTKPEGLTIALQKIVDFLALMTNASAGVVEGLEPLIDLTIEFLESLAASDSDTQQFLGNIGGLATTVNSLLPLLGFLADALGAVGGAFAIISGAKTLGIFKDISFSLTSISPTNVALAAAIGAVTFAINENIVAYEELQARERSIQLDEEHLNNTRGDIADRLKEISDTTGITIASMDALNNAIDEGAIVFDEATGSYINAGDAVVDYDKIVAEAAGSQEGFGDSILDVTTILDSLGLSADGTATSLRSLEDQQLDINTAIAKAREEGLSYNVVVKDGVKQLVTWGGAAKDAGDKLDKTAEQTNELTKTQLEAIKQTNALELQLNQLASNERIATLEFKAEIEVAQFESDAKRVEAAFTSVTDVFGLANQALTDLYATGPAESDKFGFQFDDLIDNAERRADDALTNATKLNDAQIAYMNERTKALQRGDSTITVNADGLQPELQELLRSLLEFIQIEANEEGLEMLL